MTRLVGKDYAARPSEKSSKSRHYRLARRAFFELLGSNLTRMQSHEFISRWPRYETDARTISSARMRHANVKRRLIGSELYSGVGFTSGISISSTHLSNKHSFF